MNSKTVTVYFIMPGAMSCLLQCRWINLLEEFSMGAEKGFPRVTSQKHSKQTKVNQDLLML